MKRESFRVDPRSGSPAVGSTPRLCVPRGEVRGIGTVGDQLGVRSLSVSRGGEGERDPDLM